jgi:hypothetical protein
MGVTMLQHTIVGVEWNVEDMFKGLTYTYSMNGITGVAYWESRSVFSYVVMVDDETSPRHYYDNKEYSGWNIVHKWNLLEDVLSVMYDVEDELTEDTYNTLYEIGDRYEDFDCDYEYERDSDLHNEW